LVFSLAKSRFPNPKQIRYISHYLSGKERLIIRSLLIIIVIAVIILSYRFYTRHVEYLPRQGGSYTEALVGQPKYINPILCQTNDVDMDLSHLIFSGLFKYNDKLELIPDLAQSYEVSEDQKTYTVKLKPNILWHNGNALLIDDIIYTIETIQDPDFKSPLYSSLTGITVERVDDQTIKFTLKEPYAPFLSNLTFGILPAHLWGDVSSANFSLAEYNTKPTVGSGPFKFKEFKKDQSGYIKSFTLTRNDNYYGTKPNIKEIIFKFYPDFTSAVEALKNKKIQGVSFIPKDLKSSIEKNKNLTEHALRLPQYTAVFLNQKNKLLKNADIKKALALAVDKKMILQEALKGDGVIIDVPILEGFLGYNPDIKKYEFNPQKARETLDQAGWKIPAEGGVRKKGDAELAFSLTTVDQPEYLKTADLLKEQWEAIGIGIDLKIMNPNRVDKELIKPKDYEALLYGEILGLDPDPYAFWHSSQASAGGPNLSNYGNKDVDKLLEEARKTNNKDERAKKYIEFQNILANDLPAIFLYNPTYNYTVNKKIKGINTDRIIIPSDRFNGIEGWYVNTKIKWK